VQLTAFDNGYAERLVGSIRRECLDHVIVFGERHLRTQLLNYQNYYNECRTHLSLDKDAPLSRAVQRLPLQTEGQTWRAIDMDHPRSIRRDRSIGVTSRLKNQPGEAAQAQSSRHHLDALARRSAG